jgi:MoxR-like ATPase
MATELKVEKNEKTQQTTSFTNFKKGQKVVLVHSQGYSDHDSCENMVGTILEVKEDRLNVQFPHYSISVYKDKYETSNEEYDGVEALWLVVPDKAKATKTTVKAKLPKAKIKSHQIVGQEHNQKMLEVAIKNNLPVLLIGETGTGKTSIIREQAIERKMPWIRFNLTGETTVDEFVGKYELEGGKTVWRDGILLQAMKEGKWLIVDEINVALPEILFVLHSLLDDDKFVVVASHAGEVVTPHENFRFFATMNPVDEYAGTKELNKAFQSRFNMILLVDYPDNATEARIVHDKTGVAITDANKMADIAVALRLAKEKEEIFYTCSTRDLLQWGHLIKDLGMEDAFMVSVLNKANGDKEKIVTLYDKIAGKYLNLEKAGYTLSLDWFEAEAKKLEKAKAEFKTNKAKVRADITKEIIESLTKGKTLPATATEAKEVLEVETYPF